MTAVAALMVFQRPALAEPTGGAVVAGSAAISQSANVTNINQSTNKAIINWQSFSIGAKETVNFNQPAASSVTLNRVIGNETSVISGALNANGQVFLVNSAGVLFGKGAQINVGGLVASTLDISNADFMAGNYRFSGTSQASVINQGRIRAHGGGYVSLLGKTVSNEGVISARLGTVAMASGEKITLNFDGDSLLDVTIDKGALNALVANKRAIRADGGRVIMTAKAADQVLSAQVNNTGIVQARTIAALKGGSGGKVHIGKIKLMADGGTTNVSGKLDASAPKGGDGGFIETSGDQVKVADSAVITTLAANGKTGTWLIDPNDFTIAASGGDMTAAAVVANLATTNFEIKTATMGHAGGSGDINVNQALTWNTNTTLTLTAERNVNINQAITAGGASAGLTLNAGTDININAPVTLSGASAVLAMTYGHDYNIRTKASYAGTEIGADGWPVARQDTSGGVYGSIDFTNSANTTGLTINGQTYTLIHSMSDLDLLDGQDATTGSGTASTVTGYYALARNLDANGIGYTRAVVGTFQGTLTGLGHAISNLSINAPTTALVGLIGQTPTGGATIRDIGLVNANVVGRGLVGSLLGRGADQTAISNVYTTHTVGGSASVTATGTATVGGNPTNGNGQYAGGLIGQLQGGSVRLAFADVNVSGFASTGGLIGAVFATTGAASATITNVHATGNVTMASQGTGSVGGLIGGATIGGGVTIQNAYATGDVSGRGNYFGGLVGRLGTTLGPRSSLTNSFATGDVKAPTAIAYNMADSNFYGGLVGYAEYTTFTNVYATGDVSAKSVVGGLIGQLKDGSTVNGAKASGSITGLSEVGGFVGEAVFSSAISNAFATGNVFVGLGTGGGFAGVNQGTIDNAYSTGNVTGIDIGVGGIVAQDVGGFVGLNNDTGSITNAYATGNVHGGNSVGGFAGENVGHMDVFNASGHVSATNLQVTFPVTGPLVEFSQTGAIGGLIGKNSGTFDRGGFSGTIGDTGGAAGVGGVVGWAPSGTGSNSFFDSDKNPGLNAVGEPPGFGNGMVRTNLGGLTSAQYRDLQHYQDGTISQVLEQRREEERRRVAEELRRAAAETAFRSSTTQLGSSIASAVNSPNINPPANSLVNQAVSAPVAPDIIDNIQITEPPTPTRTGSNTSSSSKGEPGSSGADFDATIRSIEVDGQRFDLQKDDKKDNGEQKAAPEKPE